MRMYPFMIASSSAEYATHLENARHCFEGAARGENANSASVGITATIGELRKAIRALEMLRYGLDNPK